MHALLLALVITTCPHDSTVGAAATSARVPPVLAQAVTAVESNCDPRAVSPTGARGLMQILPSWIRTNLAARCGTDLFDPAVNACFGTRILRYEYARTGDWHLALDAYSGRSYPLYEPRVRAAMRRLTAARRLADVARLDAVLGVRAPARVLTIRTTGCSAAARVALSGAPAAAGGSRTR